MSFLSLQTCKIALLLPAEGIKATCMGWQCRMIKSMVINTGNYFKGLSRNVSKLVSYQAAQMLMLDNNTKVLVLVH